MLGYSQESVDNHDVACNVDRRVVIKENDVNDNLNKIVYFLSQLLVWIKAKQIISHEEKLIPTRSWETSGRNNLV